MYLRTEARDCLCVNWALPLAAAPELPAPLIYPGHRVDGGEWVLMSVLCFRLSGLRPGHLPLPRVTYPQLNLRLCVLDKDRVPSTFFLRSVVPRWLAPVLRFVGGKRIVGGRLEVPRNLDGPEPWTWCAEGAGALQLRASIGAPVVSAESALGEALGGWQATVDYVRRRPRSYVMWQGKLRAIHRSQPTIEALPVRVEVNESTLLQEAFGEGMSAEMLESQPWQNPHAAWIYRSIPLVFELIEPKLLPVHRRRQSMAAVPDGA